MFSYLDGWLIKMCVIAEQKKKKKEEREMLVFLRLGFIAPCCNQTSQILSQGL